MVNEEDLIQLVKVSPVMAIIYATNELKAFEELWDIYIAHIFKEKTHGNHLVLVTGYNSINGNTIRSFKTCGVLSGERKDLGK